MNSEYLPYFPGFMFISDCNCFLNCDKRLSRSENLSFFLGFAARDLVNSENLSYFPAFMLIGDQDCVSFCHFRLSRTSENLPYFPCYVMMSENLSYFPGFISRDLMNSENLY